MSDLEHWQPSISWIEPAPVEIPPDLLEIATGSRLVGAALVRAGYTTAAAANAFLNPGAYIQTPPAELPDLETAVEYLEQAIHTAQRIGVWGDFDVDGQTSTTILVETLRALGGDVVFHIPVREYESHGVNIPYLEKFIQAGVQLILTCDTGISAHDAVHFARQRGVDVIITDHHTLMPTLPDACAIVNPQRLPAGHPLRTLPGAGTAFKLAEALAVRAGRPELAARQLELAALGTVADLAILSGDARWLVQRGLEQLRMTDRFGLQLLFQNAELEATRLTEEHIGFAIGPRLNAIGRLGDANCIVDFLTSNDPSIVRPIANQLEGYNEKRKLMCNEVFLAAQKQIERDPSLLRLPILLLSHPQWPAGVVGIVASRLVELYHRPTLLLSASPGQPARGSARSIDGVNIIEAISACGNLLLGYGGHPMAAGLSVETEKIAHLRQALAHAIEQQVHIQDLSLDLHIDSWMGLSEVNLELVEQLERLAPFGPGNPAPVFAAQDLIIKDRKPVGKEKEHLRLLVEDTDGNLQEVMWWQGDESLLPEGRFDLAYKMRASNFRGQQRVQLEFIDLRVREQQRIALAESKIKVIDLRTSENPLAELGHFFEQPGVMIWQEGEKIEGVPGCTRLQLEAATDLVVWTIPPNRSVLQDALRAVNPQRIYLCAVFPGSELPQPFLTRLAGMVRYVLQHSDGSVPLSRLAAGTAQRESCVVKGLEWLAARGIIRILNLTENEVQLAQGGSPDPSVLKMVERELTLFLQETAAFRTFYLKADVHSLIDATV